MARIHRKGSIVRHFDVTALLANCCILAVVAGATGCATVGATVGATGGATLWKGISEAGPQAPVLSGLPAGAMSYFIADIDSLRPILDRSSAVKKIVPPDALKRTTGVTAAIFHNPSGVGSRFFILASGRYPVFRAGISLFFDPDWKKKKAPSGLFYWRSDRHGLSLSLSSSRAIISDGIPESPGPGPEVPNSVRELGLGSSLALWVDSPEHVFAQFLGEAAGLVRLPTDRLLLILRPDGPGLYRGTLRVETPSKNHANALGALLNLLRPATSESFFAVPAPIRSFLSRSPGIRGSILEYADLPFEAADFALLLDWFAVY